MKRLLLTAFFVVSCVAVQALPTPEQLPDNLVFLAVGDVSESTFLEKMKARDVSFEAMEHAFRAARLETAASFGDFWFETLTQVRSLAVGIAADPETMAFNGVIVYVDGSFDAPGVIDKLIALPEVQAELAKNPAEEDIAVSVKESPLGSMVVITGNKKKIPPSAYPPIAGGFVVTLEAVSPTMLRFASSGAIPGNACRALAPKNPFAALLAPEKSEKGFFFCTRVESFDRVFARMRPYFSVLVSPEKKAVARRLLSFPIVNVFLTVRSYDVKLVELADRLQCTLDLEAATPELAEEIQEALIGYKVFLKTFISEVDRRIASESLESAAATKPLSDAWRAIVDGYKVSPVKGCAVSLTVGFTLDQLEVALKSAEPLRKMETESRRE